MSELTAAWIAAGAAIGGGLVAGLLTGAYQHWREYRNRPILAIDFQDDDYHKVEAPGDPAGGNNPPYVYIKIRVRNNGHWAAKGCRVFLSQLEEVHPSGKTTRAFFLGSRQLAWEGLKFVPLDIPSDLDFYADVVRVSKAASGWEMAVEQLFASERSLQSYKGTYRFHAVVTSENAWPARCVVDVSYDGDWHNLRAVAV